MRKGGLMGSFVSVLILATLAVAVVLLGYGLASAWRRVLRGHVLLPFFGALRREGLSPGEAREAVGVERLALAARRCVFCDSGAQCCARLAAGGSAARSCPNAGLFVELRQPRV